MTKIRINIKIGIVNTEKSILTEFLAESNKMLNQVDQGQLYDLFSPIKSYLQKQENLLSFSLTRLFGGSKELAFVMEWQTQTSFLTHNSSELFEENQIFWRKKIPVKLRGIPDLFDRIDTDISKVFLPKQLSFFENQNTKLKTEILLNYPNLQVYLQEFLTKVVSAQFGKSQLLYQENINLSQFLEYLSLGSSFLKIGLPVLTAIRFTNSQAISNISNIILNRNSQRLNEKIKADYDSQNQNIQAQNWENAQNEEINWVFLEEIIKDISCLYQISNSLDLAKFLYLQNLSEVQAFDWWQKSENNCLQILIGQKQIQQEVSNHQQKILTKIQTDIARTGLDPKTQNLLKSVANWAFGE